MTAPVEIFSQQNFLVDSTGGGSWPGEPENHKLPIGF
jgi:hypothetical protein